MYESRQITDKEYQEIVGTIREGYLWHKPNPQIATILVLEANLGCRIGDIMNLRDDSFIKDGDLWKLNITEQKTGKKRSFIVPAPVKAFIDQWIIDNGIKNDRLFTIGAAAVWKAMRQVTEYLGLDDVSTHALRKYKANKLYEATGHDIEAVATFLQHADTKTTRRYIKRSDAAMEKAINDTVTLA